MAGSSTARARARREGDILKREFHGKAKFCQICLKSLSGSKNDYCRKHRNSPYREGLIEHYRRVSVQIKKEFRKHEAQLFEDFMKERFTGFIDPQYFKEWRRRFETGTPWNYMLGKSKMVFQNVGGVIP
jgi:hypothetical protein